jgi:hypothetical protein
METNLPALCRRVWGNVPAAIPYDGEDHLSVVLPKRTDEEPRWYIPGRTHAISDDMAESMIQAAALRWLLENGGEVRKNEDGTAYGVVCHVEDDWTGTPCLVWYAWDKDLTTCLLLAVERCQEYKENSK